ncbi:hypothetical protein FK85_30175 [Halorubrum saccharovorum]|uniref:Uncharacterized protein n=1 Tax=Halorubrum saccharovorum TaxID=2248 RepID=A0A0F8AXF5_9EURY|nr:hypothetical protein FK85_30175 [Halorubrum saccharovorum]
METGSSPPRGARLRESTATPTRPRRRLDAVAPVPALGRVRARREVIDQRVAEEDGLAGREGAVALDTPDRSVLGRRVVAAVEGGLAGVEGGLARVEEGGVGDPRLLVRQGERDRVPGRRWGHRPGVRTEGLKNTVRLPIGDSGAKRVRKRSI